MAKYILKLRGVGIPVLIRDCSDKEEPYTKKTAAELYVKGYENLLKNDEKKSSEAFDEAQFKLCLFIHESPLHRSTAVERLFIERTSNTSKTRGSGLVLHGAVMTAHG